MNTQSNESAATDIPEPQRWTWRDDLAWHAGLVKDRPILFLYLAFQFFAGVVALGRGVGWW